MNIFAFLKSLFFPVPRGPIGDEDTTGDLAAGGDDFHDLGDPGGHLSHDDGHSDRGALRDPPVQVRGRSGSGRIPPRPPRRRAQLSRNAFSFKSPSSICGTSIPE